MSLPDSDDRDAESAPFPDEQSPLTSLRRLADLDHPWLGLESFREETRAYFFGRNAEISEMHLRLRSNPLLVLYGRSGLGKTSILLAGLIPRLRAEGRRPLLLRLSYGESAQDVCGQFVSAVFGWGDGQSRPISLKPSPTKSLVWTQRLSAKLGLSLPDDLASRLWLRLHYREEPLDITHLILDQFEEVFTLGARQAGAEEKVRDILAIALQGAVPEPIGRLIGEHDSFSDHFDPDSVPVRVILALRSDYVYVLNRWRSHLTQLGQNNFELRALRGPAAFDAVFKPGELRCHYQGEVSEETKAATGLPPIVTQETAQRIVRFVARKDEEVPIEEIEAVPPILSLLCRELNERRFTEPDGTPKTPAAQITFRESEADIQTIIAAFYERCLAGRPDAVRIFIEEDLVTYSGARLQQDHRSILKVFADGCKIPGASDDRRAAGYGDPGAARACLEELVNQRLLTAVGGGENPAYELVHDLLAAVVEKSRTAREERFEKEQAARRAEMEREAKEEAKRKQVEAEDQLARETRLRNRLRLALAGVTIVLILALSALWFAIQQKDRADKAAKNAKEAARQALTEKDRADKAAKDAEEAAKQALTEKDRADKAAKDAEEAARQARLAQGKVWLEGAKLNSTVGHHFAAALMAARAVGFAGYGREKVEDTTFNDQYPILLSAANDTNDEQEACRQISSLVVHLWLPMWQSPLFRQHSGAVTSVAWSLDRKTLASGSSDKTIKLWEGASGKLLRTLEGHSDPVNSVAWSHDGNTIASGSDDKTVKLWEGASGKLLATINAHTGAVNSVAWSP
jgi:hypothetical protein